MGYKCVPPTLGHCEMHRLSLLNSWNLWTLPMRYPFLVLNCSWRLWNDRPTIVNPEWLNHLPGSWRWNGFPGQALIYRMKGTANLTIASFIPAGHFFRGNPCNLNIYMCPVLSCSYIGKILVHRKKVACTPKTLENLCL